MMTPGIDKFRNEDYSADASAPDELGMTTEATHPGLMSDNYNESSINDNTGRRTHRNAGPANVSQITSEFATTSRIADTQRD